MYRIQLNPKSKPKVVHRNRLWLYTGANIPTWFEEQNTRPTTRPMDATAKPATQTNSEIESTANAGEQGTLLRRSSRNRHPPQFYQA